MNSLLSFLAIILIINLLSCTSAASEASGELPIHRQILLVTTPDWEAVDGRLQRFEWMDQKGWELVGEEIPVVVGKNGMHWGIGQKDYRSNDTSRVKQEGDLRSPAGVYAFSKAFGYADPDSLEGLRFPYVHVTAVTQCIEDTGSAYYNRIIQGDETPSDWTSTDYMRRQDNLYEWGVFVSHNYRNALPGAGSCIFLHGWRGTSQGTAGCTAMDINLMKDIVFWLDQAKNPLLVQAPEAEIEALLEAHQLPVLP